GPLTEPGEGVPEPDAVGAHDQVDGRPAAPAGVAAPPLGPVTGLEDGDGRGLPRLGSVTGVRARPAGRVASTPPGAEDLVAESGEFDAAEDVVAVVTHERPPVGGSLDDWRSNSQNATGFGVAFGSDPRQSSLDDVTVALSTRSDISGGSP